MILEKLKTIMSFFFPKVEEEKIGELEISSGGMLICDPLFLRKLPEGSIELKGLNVGDFPVKITLKYLGKMKKIIKAELGIFEGRGKRDFLAKYPLFQNLSASLTKKFLKRIFCSVEWSVSG